MENLGETIQIQQINLLCGISSFLHDSKLSSLNIQLDRNDNSNFIVSEICKDNVIIKPDTDLNFLKSRFGLFSYHILSKKGIDTPQAVKQVASHFKIPENYIDYSGLKDSKAETSQLISIWTPNGLPHSNLSSSNLNLSDGVINKYGLKYGDLIGNYFKITIEADEDLSSYENEIDSILNNITNIGFPNYFGTQRFGTNRPVSHLIGKALIQKDWKTASLNYLLISSIYEPEFIRKLRLELSETLDYSQFLSSIPKMFSYERKIAKELEQTANYQKAIFSLPKKILSLFIGSYQSFIFNWLLSKYIDRQVNKTEKIESIPLIGFDTDLDEQQDWVKKEINEILISDSVSKDSFLQENTWIRIKGSKRQSFIKPGDLKYKISKNKLILYFTLKKGSYATSLIRELIGSRESDKTEISKFKNYNSYKSSIKEVLIWPKNLEVKTESKYDLN